MVTYTTLKSGNWGVRGSGAPPREGERLLVTKKNGTTKTETIEKVLWCGKDRDGRDVWIAAIVSRKRNGCSCDADCCSRSCRCESHCNCRGGSVYDC